MLDKLNTKKLIALALVLGYLLFTGYCIVVGKQVPDSFVAILSSIIGFYFGRGNAEAEKEAKSSV